MMNKYQEALDYLIEEMHFTSGIIEEKISLLQKLVNSVPIKRTKEEIIKEIEETFPECEVTKRVCYNKLKANYHIYFYNFGNDIEIDIDVFENGSVEIDFCFAPILKLKEVKLLTELMEVLENESISNN